MNIDSELRENCFICGEKNPVSPKLHFHKIDEKTVETEFVPPKIWTGWGKIVHGGLQATLLDEAAGWAVLLLSGQYALTINMEIKFFYPVYVNEKLRIIGKVVEEKQDTITIEAELINPKNICCTKGKITYKIVNQSRIEKIALKKK